VTNRFALLVSTDVWRFWLSTLLSAVYLTRRFTRDEVLWGSRSKVKYPDVQKNNKY